jgi:HemY protein
MRKLFLYILLILVLVTVCFALLQRSEGYVLVAFAGYTIEMSFVVACLLNALLFLTLYFCWLVFRLLIGSRRSVLGWAANQRRQSGLNRTTQGLIAFVEGRWDFARKSLAKAAISSPTPLVNYLFAARASAAMGDAKAVDEFLKKAELSTEGAGVAISLTQAELQMQNGQYEQALASLLRIKKRTANHQLALGLLAKNYAALADWQSLLKLLPALKHSGVSDADIQKFEVQACCEMLVKSSLTGSQEPLRDCWKQLPSAAKKHRSVVACYAKLLISAQQFNEAEQLLRAQLQRNYDSALVRLYGLSATDQPEKQRAYAEKLLKTNPNDASLLLALGVISARDQQFEKAEAYLQQSISCEPRRETYNKLAKVYAARNDLKSSVAAYAKAAAL